MQSYFFLEVKYMVVNIRSWKEVPLWKDVTEEEWGDWRWQIANRITKVEDLRQVINLTDEEAEEIERSLGKLRMAITPYYASLMDPDDPRCPIRKQAVPSIHETMFSKADLHDPLHEDVDSPVPGLTHRYPDRGWGKTKSGGRPFYDFLH